MRNNSKFFILGAITAAVLLGLIFIFVNKNRTKVDMPSNTVNSKPDTTTSATDDIIHSKKTSPSPTKEISIKGTLKYKISDTENEADTDAKLLLICKELPKDSISIHDINLFSNGRDFDKFKSNYCFATFTDSNGNYEFKQIPKGKYVLISVSNNLFLKPTPNKDKNSSMPPNKIVHPLDSKQKALLSPLANTLNCNLDELALLLFRANQYHIEEVHLTNSTPCVINYTFTDNK
ncbi:hypothetical protein [Clostridium lundense]|uniref:hypothetical protein n=1 Tax=Clostridium lundense TaxID=319475 RepID=UPI0004828FDB|nr:hypothetical protein [Clostridium lundense]